MTASSRSSRPSTPAFERTGEPSPLTFDMIARRASACRACPTMTGRPITGFAPPRMVPPVMFIGEAPGRLGAARTGVPFRGDQSARNLERLLAAAGWAREDVFVTNAVLCHPVDARGRNRRPTSDEIRHCGVWLRFQIAAVDPLIVVTLGAVALSAAGFLAPHGAALPVDLGRILGWRDRYLVPLYHPSAQAAIHRPLALQEADFRQLRAQYDTTRSAGT